MTAPCKDCQEREVGCHGKCSRYQEFRAIKDKEMFERNAEKSKRFARARQDVRRKGTIRKREGLR